MVMLEDDGVFTVLIAATRAAVPDLMADHRLQLEGDVLDDVRRVRPTTQPGDEAATRTDTAVMFDEARHCTDESLVEVVHVRGRDVVILTDRQVHTNDGALRPEVDAARRMQRRNANFRRGIGPRDC